MSYSPLSREAEVFDIKAERERRKDSLKPKLNSKGPPIEFRNFKKINSESPKPDGNK